MLDHAAIGVRFWPVDKLREAFSRTQQATLGVDPEEAVADVTGDSEETVESFFSRVYDNVQAGRIRMVFIADRVPGELRSIVEFLNEQMTHAEVYAVEVKQYRADGLEGRTIVPTVYLQPVRNRGDNDTADAIWAGLQAITPKPLTTRYPAVPTSSVAGAWPQISELLGRLL